MLVKLTPRISPFCFNAEEQEEQEKPEESHEVDDYWKEAIRPLLRGGRGIEAIKKYRSITGSDLKAAKRIIDENFYEIKFDLESLDDKVKDSIKQGKKWRQYGNIVRSIK